MEQAIVQRLQTELGDKVSAVIFSDDDLILISPTDTLPLICVKYNGFEIKPRNTISQRYEKTDEWMVLCVQNWYDATDASLSAEELITSVLDVLKGQQFDGQLNQFGLVPVKVKNLTNPEYDPILNLAITFRGTSYFDALEEGDFPVATSDPADPDFIFSQYAAV
ncbi:DUF1834 family protein [Neisseriaceae bacterium ESL0693]|nr:DUF1834 family protein [Neisseriaceae bacterium ESL0693]